MTPQMLLFLIENDEFDWEEVDKIARGETTVDVGEGVTLLLEPCGKFMPGRGAEQYQVYVRRPIGVFPEALVHAGEMWSYGGKYNGKSRWDAYISPSMARTTGGFSFPIYGATREEAAMKMWEAIQKAKRRERLGLT